MTVSVRVRVRVTVRVALVTIIRCGQGHGRRPQLLLPCDVDARLGGWLVMILTVGFGSDNWGYTPSLGMFYS